MWPSTAGTKRVAAVGVLLSPFVLTAAIASCSFRDLDDLNRDTHTDAGPGADARDGIADADADAAPSVVCMGDACLTPLATREDSAAELLVDGDDAFWTIDKAAAGAIRTCKIAACVPRSLAADQDAPHSLVLDGQYVLWASGNEIRRTARDAVNATSLVVKGSNPSPIRQFRRLGSRIYRTADDVVVRCDYDVLTGQCTSSSGLGTAADSDTYALAIDASHDLWVASKNTIYQVDTATGVLEPRASLSDVRVLLVGTSVFALRGGTGELLALPPLGDDAGSRTLIGSGASAVVLDASTLFVAYLDGHVERVAVASGIGTPQVLASSLSPLRAIAVSPDRVFVLLDGGRIGFFSRPP